ncbi:MAG: AI-2E family transporter [Saprospiraceae bacterium]|jgi:predicted PurR-regulated permease PerM|nr:AI-2E family transporter [Saprospiraceae bacterium]
MKFNTRYLIASISLLIVGAVLYYFSEIVTYILIAWIISMIGAPIVVFLRKYLGKNIAALITLGLFLIGCMVLIWTFIPPLVNQVENLSKVDYNRVVTALEEPIKDWEKWLIKKKLMIESDTTLSTQKINQSAEEIGTPIYEIKVDSVLNSENEADSKSISINIYLPENQKAQPLQDTLGSEKSGEDFFTILKSNINNYINPEKIRMMLGDSLTAFGDIMIGLFSIFFIGFFFLREQGLFDKILTSMVPSRYEQQTKQAVDETSRLLIRYFIGILIQVTIITLIVSLSLMLMGVKNALLIGFFAGIMNVIPYIGPLVATALGVMITLSSNMELSFYDEMIPLIVKVLLVFMVTRLIDDIILQPNIFSKSVKAHPLEIFIIVLVGAKVGGILGMVLAIPFYTAFRVIGKVFLSEFRVIQQLTKNM